MHTRAYNGLHTRRGGDRPADTRGRRKWHVGLRVAAGTGEEGAGAGRGSGEAAGASETNKRHEGETSTTHG